MMNDIYIRSLSLTNFRLYRSCEIPFSFNGHYKLNAFVANNGTGKTTILYAINWCLYGAEQLHLTSLSKSDKRITDKLPIVNTESLKGLNEGDTISVNVTLKLFDEEQNVTFSRTQEFRKNNKIPMPVSDSQLEVTITKRNASSNTISYDTPEETQFYVEQYFSSRISNFYFFDGERLQDFFTSNTNVKDAIFNICQIDLLKDAIDRCKKTHTKIAMNVLSRERPDKDALLNELSDLAKKIERNTNDLADSKKNLLEVKDTIKNLNEKILRFAPKANLQKQAKELSERLETNESDRKDLLNETIQFIREYTILIALYPAAKRTLSIIQAKAVANKLPPPIDINLLKSALRDHVCPICHNEVDSKSEKIINDLIADIKVSSDTSNTLSKMMHPLEQFIKKAEQFPEQKQSLMDRSQKLKADYKKYKDEYDLVYSRIIATITNSDEFEQKEAKQELEKAEKQRDDLNTHIGILEFAIDQDTKRKEKIENELSNVLKKIKDYDTIKEECDVLDKLRDKFTKIHDEIMLEMKQGISNETEKYFSKMSPKNYTFGKISIDDSYNISAYDQNGNLMTFSMSETEFMTLAYAFTLAIHQTSGKNCPLVIDSPLGRAAGLNRTQIAKTLIENSERKQIIILFNPNELYGEVEKLFNQEKIKVTKLIISDDETQTRISE